MTLLTEGIDLNVTLVKLSTKQAQGMVNRWFNSKYGDNIYKAYKKPSSTKVSTFNEIKKEVREVDGFSLRITGAGCDIYSCAYKVKAHTEDQPDFKTYLIYHTPSNRFAICLED